jgi:hypothetical protein
MSQSYWRNIRTALRLITAIALTLIIETSTAANAESWVVRVIDEDCNCVFEPTTFMAFGYA